MKKQTWFCYFSWLVLGQVFSPQLSGHQKPQSLKVPDPPVLLELGTHENTRAQHSCILRAREEFFSLRDRGGRGSGA